MMDCMDVLMRAYLLVVGLVPDDELHVCSDGTVLVHGAVYDGLYVCSDGTLFTCTRACTWWELIY